MTEMAFQDVFNRVYLYLSATGTDMTGERFRTLLQLIDDAIIKATREGGEASVLEIAMDLVPERFALPSERMLSVSPPIQRGSIGYRTIARSSSAVG